MRWLRILVTVKYEEQLKMKENAVKKLLGSAINTEYEWEGNNWKPLYQVNTVTKWNLP